MSLRDTSLQGSMIKVTSQVYNLFSRSVERVHYLRGWGPCKVPLMPHVRSSIFGPIVKNLVLWI